MLINHLQKQLENMENETLPKRWIRDPYMQYSVVGDEVWSLTIHEPQKNVHRLSDLCRQIITDAGTRKPDEAKYMELLEEIDFRNRPQ